jgi:hypothetical protein
VTTTDLIVLACVYLFVIVAYCVGTWIEWRAVDAVRKMDAEDNAPARWAEQQREWERMRK